MRTLTRLGGVCALIAFFFPWLAFPQADPDFPGFYSYTPFRLMGDTGIVPNQLLAALPLLLVPVGALILIFTPLKQEKITRNTRLAFSLSKGARIALLLGNALVLIPVLNFYMIAFGQPNQLTAPDIGFWATLLSLLLTLTGLARALYVSRQSTARVATPAAANAQHVQPERAPSIPAGVQPAREIISQD